MREIRRRERAGLLEGRREIPILAKMRDLDERVTAPLCGFTGADDYYERCSALPHLDGVGARR
ncbi:MAG: hypothetical protein R3F34_10345 [Planctomycetota bacterium]